MNIRSSSVCNEKVTIPDITFIYKEQLHRWCNKWLACSPQSGQTKDYNIGICCFSTKNAALRKKSKDWFARNQDNVSNWDMSIRELMFQRSSTIKIQLSVLVYSTEQTSSSSHWKLTCSRHDIAKKLLSLCYNKEPSSFILKDLNFVLFG